MKYLTKITICILLLATGMYSLTSCKNTDSAIQEEFLIGSWEDSSPAALHFTLFKNGTARSDNMQTLLYKMWKVNGDRINFTIESIGNEKSTVENRTYTIEKLTRDKLILRNGEQLLHFTKKP